jgi:hypothetical protein
MVIKNINKTLATNKTVAPQAGQPKVVDLFV